MYTKAKLLYSIVLVSSFFTLGCENATRDIDSEIKNDTTITAPTEPIESPDQNLTPIPVVIEQPQIVDNNETNSTIKVDAKNAYTLNMTLSKDKYQRNELGKLHFSIKNLYTDILVDNSIIEKIKLSTPDKRYCKFVDYNGAESHELTLQKEDAVSEADIAVKMTDNSGTTYITVIATITLPDKSQRDLINTIPIIVTQNQTASIAMNSYGTQWDNSLGLYVQSYVIHVVDKYGNKAKDGTYVSIGAINDPKLYTYGDRHPDGSINNITTSSLKTDKTFALESPALGISLENIDHEDNVIILANESKNDPTYLGGWSIDQITNAQSLKLLDDYTGNPNLDINISDETGLSFVIGDEDRYNPCYQTLANGAFYLPDGATVQDGIVKAEFRYQPFMVGKTVFLYANAIINYENEDGTMTQERIGISRRVPLVGEGLSPTTVSCKNEGNTTLPSCSIITPMSLAGSNHLARWVQPGVVTTDSSGFMGVTASNTACSGETVVTFYGIPAGKTASVSVGDLIVDEKITNK